MAREAGLETKRIVITGYLSDGDLVALYNLCRAAIVPSYYEGFGLPALEAMSCGAPVIGSNASSVPEVIGRKDAMFDPHDDESIAAKLAKVLLDGGLRTALKARSLEQARKFSWSSTAQRAIAAMEHIAGSRPARTVCIPARHARPRLAYVSPLAPERTGIADYSAELLPALARFYEIVAIVDQGMVSDPWIRAHCEIRDPQWLCANASPAMRVLYHMGNSPFHDYARSLLAKIPGTLVLHDFFLGSLLSSVEADGRAHWARALYETHGYAALQERFKGDLQAIKMKYPANFGILKHAEGVIVYSEHGRRLAEQWLAKDFANNWKVIPHLRTPAAAVLSRCEARKSLRLPTDAFIVCSFGLLDPVKLNHRLLKAFLSSRLAQDRRCYLVFVGQNHGGDYGGALEETMRRSRFGSRLRIHRLGR
jgi:glycosyltransferase involved in cell wall biosynthesis